MIKSELIDKLSAQMMHLPESKVSDGVNKIIELISDSLAEERRIEIRGFGSFSVHHRSPRNAHNPKTGEKVYTAAKSTPHFKAGKSLRERINASSQKHRIHE